MKDSVELQTASDTILKFFVGLRRVIISSLAVVVMLVMYGLGSLTSYGVCGSWLDGRNGLGLGHIGTAGSGASLSPSAPPEVIPGLRMGAWHLDIKFELEPLCERLDHNIVHAAEHDRGYVVPAR